MGEALQYRGFASLAWGLLLRYLGWFLLLFLILFVAFAVIDMFMLAFSGPTSGVGAVAAGAGAVGHGFALGAGVILVVAVVIVLALIFCRYMFVFQMFAIERASGPDFWTSASDRTKQVWKTAALVLLAGVSQPAFSLLIDRCPGDG